MREETGQPCPDAKYAARVVLCKRKMTDGKGRLSDVPPDHDDCVVGTGGNIRKFCPIHGKQARRLLKPRTQTVVLEEVS